jgi:hypothetical protein
MNYGLISMTRRNLPTLRALRTGPGTLCIRSTPLSLQCDARLNFIVLYLRFYYSRDVAIWLLHKLLWIKR